MKSIPMQHGDDFVGGPEEEEEESLKICQNGIFETQLGHFEEGERWVGEAKKEGELKMFKEEEESSLMEVEKEEVEKEEMEKVEEMKVEKMFADSCVQTGPPSFRMVRFKQEPTGAGSR